jgi:uncharacterized Tic20 family protein
MAIYKVLILISGIFGLLGACIAFLITWSEQKRRDIVGKNAVKEGVKMAVFTFIFFVLLSLVLAFIFSKLNL